MKVLIIDSNLTTAQLAKSFFAQEKGCEVSLVSRIDDARTCLSAVTFDLVVVNADNHNPRALPQHLGSIP